MLQGKDFKSEVKSYFHITEKSHSLYKNKPLDFRKKINSKTCAWLLGILSTRWSSIVKTQSFSTIPISGIQSCVLHGSFSSGLSCGSHWVLVVMSSDRHRTSRTLNPPSQDLEHWNTKAEVHEDCMQCANIEIKTGTWNPDTDIITAAFYQLHHCCSFLFCNYSLTYRWNYL